MEKVKVILKGRVYFNDNNPFIELSDEAGNVIIGSVMTLSVEELARKYQKDFEYRSKDRGNLAYFIRMEGQEGEMQLFQRIEPQGYGEPGIVYDETNKY